LWSKVNIFKLMAFGNLIEHIILKVNLMTIFLLSGVFSSILSIISGQYVVTIGASGGIYGLIGAYIFMPFLALTTLPAALSEFVSSLPLPPKAIMFIVILLYIILGMFMDTMAMILITIPIFFPLALELGFGPLWFGIIVVRVMEIGMITPPMGLGIWVISGITNTPLDTISKGIIPFLIADILHVVTLLFIPSVVMFLPNIF